MKKIYYAAALAAAICLAGCTHDLDYNMVGDKVGFSVTGNLIEPSIFNDGTGISVIKSGKGFDAAKVTIEPCSQEELDKFNGSTHNFLVAPYSKYTIEETSFSFGKGDIRKSTRITWDKTYFSNTHKNGDEYAIAFKITDCNIDVDSTRAMVVIHPLMSSVSFKEENLKYFYPVEGKVPEVGSFSGEINLDNAVAGQDVSVKIAVDNSLIADISAERETDFKQAPQGLFTIDDEEVTIKAGEQFGYFRYTVDQSVLYDSRGKFIEEGAKYIVPLRLTDTRPEILAKGSFPVTYVVISPSDDSNIEPPTGKMSVIHGPWTILEGEDQHIGKDPACTNPSWYGNYNVGKLVDWTFGNTDDPAKNGYWGSWWWTEPVMPMTFVFELDRTYIFGNFYKVDANATQGQFRDFEVYVAKEYAGEETNWKLAAKGRTDYPGWQKFGDGSDTDDILARFSHRIPSTEDAEGEFHYTRGQYIKLVIVKKSGAYPDTKGGYLSEFYAEGWVD